MATVAEPLSLRRVQWKIFARRSSASGPDRFDIRRSRASNDCNETPNSQARSPTRTRARRTSVRCSRVPASARCSERRGPPQSARHVNIPQKLHLGARRGSGTNTPDARRGCPVAELQHRVLRADLPRHRYARGPLQRGRSPRRSAVHRLRGHGLRRRGHAPLRQRCGLLRGVRAGRDPGRHRQVHPDALAGRAPRRLRPAGGLRVVGAPVGHCAEINRGVVLGRSLFELLSASPRRASRKYRRALVDSARRTPTGRARTWAKPARTASGRRRTAARAARSCAEIKVSRPLHFGAS